MSTLEHMSVDELMQRVGLDSGGFMAMPSVQTREAILELARRLRLGEAVGKSAPSCGFCKDTGTALWIMGDYLRACGYCQTGKDLQAAGYFTDVHGIPLEPMWPLTGKQWPNVTPPLPDAVVATPQTTEPT